jgi:hypothetical protein
MSLSNHSAAGANAAFIYQFPRALFWLASSPSGFKIGIETDDDVAVQGSEGERVLEQDKHSIQADAQPFGDRSVDLWKTLSIWIDALDTGEVDADKTKFLMVTNKTLPDCLAKKIGRAKEQSEITECVNSMKAISAHPVESTKKFMARVMRMSSSDNLKKLIKNCEFNDASDATAGTELNAKTISYLQLQDNLRKEAVSILNELRGWILESALSAWQKGLPAWIERDHFVNQFQAIVGRENRKLRRERSEHLIPVAEDDIGQHKASLFVKQMYLVSDDDSVIDTAIREFIRCSIEKLRLSVDGNVTDEDWIAFDTTLQARWDKIRNRIKRLAKQTDKEEDVGFEIFTETTEEHREKLAGSDTEQVYLTSGTYHRLANNLKVGWHPQYDKILTIAEVQNV